MSQELITGVMTEWLRVEIVQADTGNNATLSEFDARRAELFMPANAEGSQHGSKLTSHYSRLNVFLDYADIAAVVSNDAAAAKLTFFSMMFISGNYRTQCLFEAENAEHYRDLRYSRPIGIDLSDVVGKTIAHEKANIDNTTENKLKRLVSNTRRANELNRAMHEDVHMALSGADVRQIDSHLGPSEVFQNAQRMWAGLAVAQIMVVASCREGGLAEVPFSQPASISAQTEPNFPFTTQQ